MSQENHVLRGLCLEDIALSNVRVVIKRQIIRKTGLQGVKSLGNLVSKELSLQAIKSPGS